MADTSIANDVYPNPEEIKEYVSVGVSPEYSIAVHKSTFDTGFLLFTIIFGAVLIIVVIIIIILSYNITKPQPIPQVVVINSKPLTMNSNYGAVPYATYPTNKRIQVKDDGSAFTDRTHCLSSPNTQWINNKCQCNIPYFGETCSQEKFDSRYFSVGVPDESNLNITVLEEFNSNGKSFNNENGLNSCSDYCNKNSDCEGFLYHNPNNCTLLTGDIIIPKGDGISYSNNIDSTLYMKTPDKLHFEGRIFLGEYVWSFPSRYWLFTQTNDYVQIIPGIVNKINFYPQYIRMYGEYTGIYCPYPFNSEHIHDILNNHENSSCYIHEPGTSLNVPPDFKYRPIYVTYI